MAIVGSFLLPHPPIIIPEVGNGNENKIRKTADACKRVARTIKALSPDAIVVVSPHARAYTDCIDISSGKHTAGNLASFGADNAVVHAACDTEFVQSLFAAAQENDLRVNLSKDTGEPLDHGTVIPLIFVQKEFRNFRLVRTGISGLSATDHYEFGRCIATASRRLGRRTVFIASGDLSHCLKPEGPYGYNASGPEFDKEVTAALRDADFLKLLALAESDLCEGANECGMRPLLVLAGTLDSYDVKSEMLSYEDTFGVGYAVASFKPLKNNANRNFSHQF